MGEAMQPGIVVDARQLTDHVTRGVCRMLADSGYGTLKEFRLASGRCDGHER